MGKWVNMMLPGFYKFCIAEQVVLSSHAHLMQRLLLTRQITLES